MSILHAAATNNWISDTAKAYTENSNWEQNWETKTAEEWKGVLFELVINDFWNHDHYSSGLAGNFLHLVDLFKNTEASAAAAQSIADDLMRHGEARGVEIILTDITVTGDGASRVVTASAGIADSHARLQITLEATVTFS